MSPQLLATASAALFGFAGMLLAGGWLARRWDGLDRRKKYLFGGALALFELVFLFGFYGWFIEPNRLVVREITIASMHWSGAPLRIVAVADLNVTGLHVSGARVEDIVARIDGLRPDLVVLLGDYVGGDGSEMQRSDRDREQIEAMFTAFALLNARMGVVAVLGEHDQVYGREPIARGLENGGVAVLADRYVEITRRGGGVVIAGLAPDRADFTQTLDGAPSLDTIVLGASPQLFARMPASIALMLSSCDHGLCGRLDDHGRTLYATSGIGGKAFRIFNPPEIVMITLGGVGAQIRLPPPE